MNKTVIFYVADRCMLIHVTSADHDSICTISNQIPRSRTFLTKSTSKTRNIQKYPVCINFIYIFKTALNMTSKAITVGVGIPMIIVGVLMVWLWAPTTEDLQNQVELVGGTIGILGIVFFVAGLFYTKEPVMH